MSSETIRPDTPADRWFDSASDWLNAILVKETRQALKSRQFVSTFLLLLTASWVLSLFVLLTQGEAVEYGAIGRDVFYYYFVVLAVATVLITPFTAFRSLVAERDYNTWELLSATTLSPRQIVWGKLLSALVQLLIFYSAITPFIAFASVLQGFDVPSAAYILIASMLFSLLLSMTALLLSSLANTRVSQGFMTLLVLGGLGIMLITTLSAVFDMIWRDTIDVTSGDFWWGTLAVLLVCGSYFLLFQQITTAQLTFESGNRSTGIRLVASGQFWLLWLALLVSVQWLGAVIDMEVLVALALMATLHWSAIGLFMISEGDHLSRRIRRDLPANPLLRAAHAPLLPGGARGYAFLLMHLAALWLIVVALIAVYQPAALPRYPVSAGSSTTPASSAIAFLTQVATFHPNAWTRELQFFTALCIYPLIYLGIGCALARWGMRASVDVRPAHIRVITFLILMGGVLAPFIPRVLSASPWHRYTLLDITNPFWTLTEILYQNHDNTSILTLLAIGGVLAVAVNGRAVVRGLIDVIRGPIVPSRRGLRTDPHTAAVAASPGDSSRPGEPTSAAVQELPAESS